MFVVPLVMAPSYLEVGASGKPGAVHPHLIDLGFLTWVAAQSGPRLFYEERPGEAADGRRSRKTVAINRLADWVRALSIPAVKSGDVSPNHGWRHRFATELVNLDVPDTLRKRLMGHTLDGQDNRYVGRIVMERLHQAVLRVPRFEATP